MLCSDTCKCKADTLPDRSRTDLPPTRTLDATNGVLNFQGCIEEIEKLLDQISAVTGSDPSEGAITPEQREMIDKFMEFM